MANSHGVREQSALCSLSKLGKTIEVSLATSGISGAHSMPILQDQNDTFFSVYLQYWQQNLVLLTFARWQIAVVSGKNLLTVTEVGED